MIRINLLASDRPAAKASSGLTAASKVAFGGAGLLLAAASFVGWSYWSTVQASTRMDQDIAVAQQETTRLRGVLQQVQQFDQQKAQLQQRVALIEQLRAQQTGPVHMLDQISRALPPMLWLTELKQDEKTNAVVIEGRSATLTNLSDFVANLEGSGYFKKSVEILNSHTSASRDGAELVQFSVRAQFVQPGAAAEPAAAREK